MTTCQDRSTVARRVAISSLIVLAGTQATIAAEKVLQLKNRAGQGVAAVLSGGGVFTTDFKGVNDAQVTLLNGSVPGPYDENFGGSSPGNNPVWITSFVGDTAHGTGNGTAGVWTTLNTSSSPNRVQFDFSLPLAAGDRILVADVDNDEQYQLQAFTKVGAAFVAASAAGWAAQNFSGQTGVAPDARWPVWDGATGFLTATGSGLSEPLTVLTLDQSIDRIVFVTSANGGGSPTIQFASAATSVSGDYDNDGDVDGADLLVWQRGGSPNPDSPIDLSTWKSAFGTGGVTVAAAAVPEPPLGRLTQLAIVCFAMVQRGREPC